VKSYEDRGFLVEERECGGLRVMFNGKLVGLATDEKAAKEVVTAIINNGGASTC
jgi:hypothetical protein